MSQLTIIHREKTSTGTPESIVIQASKNSEVVITLLDNKIIVDGYLNKEPVPSETFVLE